MSAAEDRAGFPGPLKTTRPRREKCLSQIFVIVGDGPGD